MKNKSTCKGYQSGVESVIRLLTYLNTLQGKHVPVQTTYPLCGEGPETIVHILVSCSFATQCWGMLNSGLHHDGMDFSGWLSDVLKNSNRDHRAEVVTLCWMIWRARNDWVWNKKHSTMNKVVAKTKQYLT